MAEYKVCKTIENEKHAMRDTFRDVLMELAGKNRNVVYMDADLMNSVGMVKFQDAYPEQTINCGIQEANMIGVAAGLSSMGKIPYAHTFGCFASRRVADQVFISCAFAQANVRIIGSDPGVTAAFNGGTHMPFEDIGIMRVIPGMTIIEPTDSVMLDDILRQAEKLYGNFYIRLSRKNAEKIYEDGAKFDIGKAAVIREGGRRDDHSERHHGGGSGARG
jgi:transketolase